MLQLHSYRLQLHCNRLQLHVTCYSVTVTCYSSLPLKNFLTMAISVVALR
jgi:hypothetical protein